MRRLVPPLALLATLFAIGTPGVSVASARTCPPSSSGWHTFEILGEPGDPAPARGEDPVWDFTEDLAAIEGLTLAELAGVFGLPGENALYADLLGFMIAVDYNSDGTICIKGYPLEQDHYPAYIFGGLDNKAKVPDSGGTTDAVTVKPATARWPVSR